MAPSCARRLNSLRLETVSNSRALTPHSGGGKPQGRWLPAVLIASGYNRAILFFHLFLFRMERAQGCAFGDLMSSQYIYTMNRVSKVVPPKRQIIKDISLSFFPGAKIGLLGLNGSGKSTVLKIMAGVDTDFEGEARPQAGIKVGYLAQEPELDPTKTVRESVEEGVGEVLQAQAALDAVYLAYAEEGADFDKLAKEQERLEAILAAGDAHTLENQLDVAADALRLPPWEAVVGTLSGGEKRRVALCRLLLQKPDMLLLDEPTNHLDAESVEWLEQFLARYTGTVVAVTHDRYFLDNAAEWIPGTGPRPRHSVEGQLHRLADPEGRPPAPGRQPGKVPPEGDPEGTGMVAPERQGRPYQGQGASCPPGRAAVGGLPEAQRDE